MNLFQKMLATFFLLTSIFFSSVAGSVEIEHSPRIQTQGNNLLKDGSWYADQVASNARNNPEYAVAIANEALDYFTNNADPDSQAKVLNESSYAFYFLALYPQAMQRAKQAEAFAIDNEIASSVIRAKILQANVLQSIGSYQQAVVLYQQAVNYYRTRGNTKQLGRVLNNIANTYLTAKKYNAAIDFYNQSHQHAQNVLEHARHNLGLANSYSKQGKKDLAILHFNRALDFYKKGDDELGQELVLTGLSSVFSSQKKYAESIAFLEQALNIAEQSQRSFRVANIHIKKANSLIGLEKYEQAMQAANFALEYAKLRNDRLNQVYALRVKMDIYKHHNQFDLYLQSLESIERLEQEYEGKQEQDQLAVMQVLLEVETKDHQISLLSAENDVQQLKIEQQRVTTIAVIVASLFLITILVFFFYRRTQSRLLKEQKETSRQLEELNRLKTQLLANTSHELRTPLNGIIGMTQLLLDNDLNELSEDSCEQVKIIEGCGKRLLSLIEDILDLTQLQASQLKIRKKLFEIKPVIQEVAGLLEHLAAKKGLKIKQRVEPDNIEVLADPKRLHQILNNLVGNAIKFSQQGTITIVAKQQDGDVEISIKDEGDGIPEKDLKQIFLPFSQADTSSRRANEGSGLGLPITKELLMLHGSDIRVRSHQGKGAEFIFNLQGVSTAE